MKKDNIRMKTNITLQDRANAIDLIVSSCFTDEDEYVPYMIESGVIVAIMKNFIDGVEFESGDNYIELYEKDEELRDIVDSIHRSKDFYNYIEYDYREMIEHRKNLIVHKNYNTERIADTLENINGFFNDFREFMTVIIESFGNFAKLNLSDMTAEDKKASMEFIKKLAKSNMDLSPENIAEVIKEASGFNMDDATAEIIDAKNQKIRELEKYKALWESRNVKKG